MYPVKQRRHGAEHPRANPARTLAPEVTGGSRTLEFRLWRTAAMGLLSPPSMSEIIERLTPLLLASASNERCCAARGPRHALGRFARDGRW
jgi:hypothetical protein